MSSDRSSTEFSIFRYLWLFFFLDANLSSRRMLLSQNRYAYLFLGALIALGFVVGYLVLGLSSQAEQVSILVYYCLVLGVLGEILQNILKSQKNSHHHESSHFIDYEK